MQAARLLTFIASASIPCLITSCGGDTDELRVATGTVGAESARTTASLYNRAYAAQQAGKTSKAIDLYGDIADKYPLAKEAPISRYREANLLYQTGKLKKSFEAFQNFITSYSGTREYADALAKQNEVAHAAATGRYKHNFIGIKSKVAATTAEDMLSKVRDNAPHGPTAPKAQFAIGQLWQENGNYPKAITAYQQVQTDYPKSSLAPEALFRVGSLLMTQADKGNRNKANLDQARNTFIDLKQLYPNSKQAKAAQTMLSKVGSQDVQRSYEVAEFYRKKGENASAAYYYGEVIRQTKAGTRLHDLAKQRRASVTR